MTFFRAADDESGDPLGPAAYVTGFEDQDGEPWGMVIPLGPEDVEPVVLSGARFSISMRPDGNLLIEGDGLCDSAIEWISNQGIPAQAAVNELVREALRPDLLAMEDDAPAELRKLRDRLSESLKLVNQALRSLKTAPFTSPVIS